MRRMHEATWAREDCGAVLLSAVRREAEAGPPRMLRNGGRLCAGAYLRGKSILYVTFNMNNSTKAIPSQKSMVRYLKCERTHQHTLARTRTCTRTRTNAHWHPRARTRRALTYETMGAAVAPRWTREQWRSATKASKRRPSTRCKRKPKAKAEAKAPVDPSALRLLRVACAIRRCHRRRSAQ